MNKDDKTNVNILQEEEEEGLKGIKEMIEGMDYDQAQVLLEEKFQNDPNCIAVIDLLSEVYFSIDNIEGAIKMFRKSISLDPENNPDKYMTLAQLLQKPKTSLECYQKGIELFIKQLSSNPDSSSIKDSIASGYASIADLYMTTVLCDEADAESICEQCISHGLSYNPSSFDVLLQLSNLRILRKRDAEALEAMEKMMGMIKAIDTNHPDFPEHDLILNLSKNYAELEMYTPHAVFLLEILVKIDDEDLECWYLLAFYHYQVKNYQFAMKCLKNFQKAHGKVIKQGKGDEIKEYEDAAKELYKTLSDMGAGIGGELMNMGNEGDEEEFEIEEGNGDEDEEMK